MDSAYPRFYYETIARTGIDPVVCGPFGEGLVSIGAEGCEESGGVSAPRGRHRPAQLAEKALAKASEGSARVPRKRAPRKATGAAAKPAVVPAQTPTKSARGTAKVASSE